MDNQDALQLLKEVVQIKSILGKEKVVADKLQVIFEKYDIPCEQVEYSEGRNQLVATLKGNEAGSVLGFSGHMDVVPVGEIPWDEDPFAAFEKDGLLYGRGTCDMKSGLIAAVVAMTRLKEAGSNFKGTIKLLATVGEETSAIGSGQLVDKGYADDLDALVIGEPTNVEIGVAHKGALWPRITTYGKTAHGSMPDQGVNAIEHMLLVLNAFKETFDFSQSVDELVGASTSSLDIINGGNGTNVVPDKCTVEIDIRTIKAQDHSELKQQFKEMLDKLTATVPDFKAEIEFINDLPSMKTELNDPFTVLTQKVVSKVTSETANTFGMTGYTDGSQFGRVKKEFPILILGPGETKYAHQPNEFVNINDFYQMITINENIAKEFLK
ncbi:ArgE/DapE family deacylase [Enterococcus ureasiticus]|uniref:Probable succinyl-diaminopimelate desuccinylase n=1 Tax=Enterococcus ureasiticus TaxID=903984 RepID=A0A1E5GGS7_9ENTE|nr:ArgE/DapE family deacylase [Enterococcus ureasiticus]OEG11933.1 acetylornithine deacetylase [Enterococcus ureasiticus]